MAAAEARVKRFEDEGHKVRLSAVFDNASLGRARQLFTQLDNQLSREAMQRLRSSPQGSVLGALNALFSPHPVTGGPSASQSASGGLLGRIIQAPGGGLPGRANVSSILLGGTGPGGTAGGIARIKLDPGTINDLANAIGNQLPDTPSGPDPGTAHATANVARAAASSAQAAASSDDAAKSAAQAARDNANSSRSLLSRLGIGGGGGGRNVALVGGGGGGGGRGLTGFLSGSAGPFTAGIAGGIGPGILGLNAKTAGIVGLGGSLLGAVPALLGGVAAGGVGLAGAGAAGALFQGVQKQISPASQAFSQAQAAQQAAVTPQQVKAANAQMASAQAQIAQLSPALRSIFNSEQAIGNWWKAFTGSFAPQFAGPLHQVAGMLVSLTGPLHTFFAGAMTTIGPLVAGLGDLARMVLPLLGHAFAAAAPLLRPVLDGLGQLVAGILPGLTTLIRAAAPAVTSLFGGLAGIGRDLGQMFAIMAPVLKSSSVLLRAFLDLIGGLLPIVGQLAAIFATALAPVFVQFAGVIRALLPFLTTIGHVLAALAGAVLGDLVSAFGALAQLLVGIAPALNAFATAFSQVFTVLENSGVFAIIGDALESLVKPLTTAINLLLRGLTPLLPPIIKFIGQLSSELVTGLTQAIVELLPPLTQLAVSVLQSLVKILPVLLPLLLGMTRIFTVAVVRAIGGVATALADIINAVPPAAMTGLVVGLLGLVGAFKALAIAKGIISGVKSALQEAKVAILIYQSSTEVAAVKSAIAWVVSSAKIVGAFIAQTAAATAAWIAENAATLGIIAGITLLVAAIVYLATHWHKSWTDIKNWALDAWHFLDDILHNKIVQIILGIIAPLALLALHWKTTWAVAKQIASDFWNWLRQVFGTDIANFFTKTIPGWYNTLLNGFRSWSGNVKNVFNDLTHWIHQVFGTDLSNFVTKTIPGWFDSGQAAVGRVWGKIYNAIKGPIKSVVNATIVPLFNAIDDVTNFVGLHKPLQGAVNFLQGMATGGKVTRGSHETADDVLIRVSRNETVLSAAHSRMLAPLLGMVGVPGYASGGLVNPIGRGARPERVDMGVDYGGFFPLYALGSGTITSTDNSGWPGGTFIDLRLSPPYGSGYWYYAEDIQPAVRVGQGVSAGQLIGHAWGGPSGIEVGWASGVGGQTAAARDGQSRAGQQHGDPGAFPTAWGVAASNLIGSLGGPKGIVSGPIHGGTAGIGGIIKTIAQIFSGLGRFATTAIDIAKGNFGGALSSILGIFKPNSGGAGGVLGQTLLHLPGQLAGDVIHHIVNAVKSFVSGQQGGGGGIPNVAATGPIQAFARKLVDATWGDAQWPYFADIVRRESNWDVHATNPGSGAYGIPQALPGSKMASMGADWRTNPYTQLRWMVWYILKGHPWGTPARADANEVRNHWYASGGTIREPVIGFGQVSGDKYHFGENGPEWVTPMTSGGGHTPAAIGNVFIQLPEGQTVARALTDLNFWLSVARQQGWAGGMPGA